MQCWPDSACLDDGRGGLLSSPALKAAVDELAARLGRGDARTPLALAGDNSSAWVVADLAVAQAGRAVVPIPGFFTREQIAHVCSVAGISEVLLDGQLRAISAVWPDLPQVPSQHLTSTRGLPEGTQKITFTSGTTGQPKGICLTWKQQQLTARSLVKRLSDLKVRIHLNLLPLAVLLENIAGVHAPLMMGARVVTPSLSEVGLRGSSDFDARRCLQAIAAHEAESVILLPQMLHALVGAIQADASLRNSVRTLKFVAVGGAPTPLAVLTAAREMGIPVYEGYGLTECASVCCLNGPDADCPGTVGIALPGLSVGLTEDGEVWVEGRSHAGVLGQAVDAAEGASHRIMTGDIGRWIAHEGKTFLQIIGRHKHVLITSFGRNVSPEWPERLLMDSGLFRQAVVLGDGQPSLRAVLVPVMTMPADNAEAAARVKQMLQSAVERANTLLPDYAQVAHWHVSAQPFTYANGLATANGRPLRQRIEQVFADAFNA